MKTIALIAYDLNPNIGSECGVAHLWLTLISKHYNVDVFVDEKHKGDILLYNYQNIRFHFVKLNGPLISILRQFKLYNLLNFIFISEVKKNYLIKNKKKFAFLHIITPMGLHSWNNLYTLGVPVVIGPVIGGLKMPKGVLLALGLRNYIREFLKSIYFKVISSIPTWRRYFTYSQHVIIGAEHVRKMIPKSCENVSMIFNCCIDAHRFVPSLNKFKKKRVEILFVGRLLHHKGVLLLLDACKILRGYGNLQFHVLIHGRGPLEKEIRRLIIQNNLQQFVTLKSDFITTDELVKIYQYSDIFCFPSLIESGGMVILEAMACGLPIITSDYGGPRYSVTDDCGIKIKVENYNQYVSDLADAIVKLVKDEDLRKRMGENARRRVEKEFSLEALEGKILKVYKEVLDEIN